MKCMGPPTEPIFSTHNTHLVSRYSGLNLKADIFQYDPNFCPPPGFQVLGMSPRLRKPSNCISISVSCLCSPTVLGSSIRRSGLLPWLLCPKLHFFSLAHLAGFGPEVLSHSCQPQRLDPAVFQCFGLDTSEYKKMLKIIMLPFIWISNTLWWPDPPLLCLLHANLRCYCPPILHLNLVYSVTAREQAAGHIESATIADIISHSVLASLTPVTETWQSANPRWMWY